MLERGAAEAVFHLQGEDSAAAENHRENPISQVTLFLTYPNLQRGTAHEGPSCKNISQAP